MASVRSRRFRDASGKLGEPHWYVLDRERVFTGKRRWKQLQRSCGPGKKGRQIAIARAALVNEARIRMKHGLPVEHLVRSACWTLDELRVRDLERAKRDGLVSLPRRKAHWRLLLAGFGKDLRLDQITPAALDRYIRARLAGQVGGRRRKDGTVTVKAGPAAVNRDLRAVLGPALALARELSAESGFTGDPLKNTRPLNERRLRRRPRALTMDQAARLVREAWRAYGRAPEHFRAVWFQNACIIELWLLTTSRYSQIVGLRWDQVGRDIVFPPQKDGEVRRSRVVGRVAAILAALPRSGPWVFAGSGQTGHRDNLRRFWKTVTKAAGLAGLRPHDLRHTSNTFAHESGATTADLMERLGHQSRQMVDRVYTHRRGVSMPPVKITIPKDVAGMLALAGRRRGRIQRPSQTH